MIGQTTPWRVERIETWPFGLKVIDADGTEVFAQHAWTNSSKQRTRQDNEQGIGFPLYKRHDLDTTQEEAAAAIAQQDARAEYIVKAVNAHDDLVRTLRSINRVLSPAGRTMDELMRDMSYACDAARAALQKAGASCD